MITQLKQNILPTLRQEFTQTIQTDVKQLQTNLTHLQQTITRVTEKSNTDIQSIQQQLAVSNKQFKHQMNEMVHNFQHQMQTQQAQMMALFQQFNNPNPQ